jgi:ABC-type glycerol-3-phosphate transport system substrate-binding protein
MFTGAFGECFAAEFYPRLATCGGKLRNASGKVTFDSPEVMDTYRLLIDTSHYSPEDFMIIDNGEAVKRFLQGESAMLMTFRSPLSDMDSYNTEIGLNRIGFDQVPGRQPLFGGWMMSISSHTRNPDIAFSFIEWACGTRIAPYMTILTGQSAVGTVYENDELLLLYPWLSMYKKAYKHARQMMPQITNRGCAVSQKEINKVIHNVFIRTEGSEVSLEEAIKLGHMELVSLFNPKKEK